ncbi:MAG: signal peptidase I [Flavobacteriales bacterium]|nr:signal peptidase I [Flavobacteriales bacterium]
MENILILLLIMQLLHFVCTWKLYTLAGYKTWQAAVPFYSAYILMKIIDRPWWWFLLLYIPVVGNIMTMVIWTDTSRAFGYRGFKWCLLSIITLGLSLGYISYFGTPKYDAQYREHRQKLDSSALGAIVFAIVAASLIKAFTYEAYTIPTSSMEGSMLVGYFLFVNKMAYGTRIAMTPLSAPLVHDSLPFFHVKSYIKGIDIPYFRLPALRSIKRNDIVVFNWPTDDPSDKPIDKKANYIKRCVGVAGDTIEIIEGNLFVNGAQQQWSERDRPQWAYSLTYGSSFYRSLMEDGVELADQPSYDNASGSETVYAFLSDAALAKVKAKFPGIRVQKLIIPSSDKNSFSEYMFPEGKRYNVDNYGPLYIPKKGDVITLTPDNISQYRNIITTHEGNTLEEKDGQYIINGTPTTTYTIAQNYYFMMGDNRHNSLDSRYWGYVPQDHIVGTPALIWLSIKADDGTTPFFKRIRWERVISFPMGEGPLKSYLWQIVAIGVVLYGAYYIYRKRKNKCSKKKQ